MRTTLQPLLDKGKYTQLLLVGAWNLTMWGHKPRILLYVSTCVWITMSQGQTISGAYNCPVRTTLTPSKTIPIDSTPEGNHIQY